MASSSPAWPPPECVPVRWSRPPRSPWRHPLISCSTAVPTVVAFCVVDDWFTTHRASAMGLVSTGAPIGGILFRLTLRAFFGRFDWKTSVWLLCAIIGALVLIGSLLVRSQPRPRSEASWDFGHFAEPKFL